MRKSKQFWSVGETNCLVAIWSSSEIQQQLNGATSTMQVFRQIQREMAAKGFDRELKQVMNKIHKLTKEYSEQKSDNSLGRGYWIQRNPYFEVLDSVFSTRTAGQPPEDDTTVSLCSTDPGQPPDPFPVRECGGGATGRTKPFQPDKNSVQQPTEAYNTVRPSFLQQHRNCVEQNVRRRRSKQFWSVGETKCLVAIWSSADIQQQLNGATSTKKVFQQIQREMATMGFYRELKQVMNKIQKLTKEYSEQKNDTSRSIDYWVQRNPYFQVLDSVLSTRPAGQLGATGSDTVSQSSIEPEMGLNKQYWSVEETHCLLVIWASSEVQEKLVGATRTKQVYKEIQYGMAAQGYERTLGQIINRIKKLKRDFLAQKNDMSKDRAYWLRRNPHFEILDSVLSTRAVGQPQAPEDHTVLESFTDSDMEKCRQMWSVPETNLLLQIWSSVEVQGKLDGATRTKHIYEQIQRKMAAHGYSRSFKQIIHKLINLKQQNKNWNSHPSRNNHFWVRKHKHVKALDLVLGDTPACQLTGVESSAPVQQDTEDNTVSHYSTDSDRSTSDVLPATEKMAATEDNTILEICNVHSVATKDDVTGLLTESVSLDPVKMEPSENNSMPEFSIDPSCQGALRSAPVKNEAPEDNTMLQSINSDLSSTDDVMSELIVSGAQDCSSNSSSPQPRLGKRKRDISSDMLEHLERLQERYLQHSREMQEALLNKMDTHMTALLGLMGRMVAAVEAQASKKSL